MNKVVKDMQQEDVPVENTTENEVKDIRKDKTKEYIYFSEVEHVVEELDIEYKNININFGDNDTIVNELNSESKKQKEALEYDATLGDDAPYNKLVKAEYKKYEVYTYENYISLIVDYFEYTTENLISYSKTKTYVFNKDSGNLINSNELLNTYNLSENDMKDKIRDYIEAEDLLEEGQELDAEATVENLQEYPLFVDKIGRLSISILVKSDQKDYNEIIILS